MKTQQTNVLQPLSNNEMVKLASVQKETVAIADYQNNKVFSSADLWNIRRLKRTLTTRRSTFIW